MLLSLQSGLFSGRWVGPLWSCRSGRSVSVSGLVYRTLVRSNCSTNRPGSPPPHRCGAYRRNRAGPADGRGIELDEFQATQDSGPNCSGVDCLYLNDDFECRHDLEHDGDS